MRILGSKGLSGRSRGLLLTMFAVAAFAWLNTAPAEAYFEEGFNRFPDLQMLPDSVIEIDLNGMHVDGSADDWAYKVEALTTESSITASIVDGSTLRIESGELGESAEFFLGLSDGRDQQEEWPYGFYFYVDTVRLAPQPSASWMMNDYKEQVEFVHVLKALPGEEALTVPVSRFIAAADGISLSYGVYSVDFEDEPFYGDDVVPVAQVDGEMLHIELGGAEGHSAFCLKATSDQQDTACVHVVVKVAAPLDWSAVPDEVAVDAGGELLLDFNDFSPAFRNLELYVFPWDFMTAEAYGSSPMLIIIGREQGTTRVTVVFDREYSAYSLMPGYSDMKTISVVVSGAPVLLPAEQPFSVYSFAIYSRAYILPKDAAAQDEAALEALAVTDPLDLTEDPADHYFTGLPEGEYAVYLYENEESVVYRFPRTLKIIPVDAGEKADAADVLRLVQSRGDVNGDGLIDARDRLDALNLIAPKIAPMPSLNIAG